MRRSVSGFLLCCNGLMNLWKEQGLFGRGLLQNVDEAFFALAQCLLDHPSLGPGFPEQEWHMWARTPEAVQLQASLAYFAPAMQDRTTILTTNNVDFAPRDAASQQDPDRHITFLLDPGYSDIRSALTSKRRGLFVGIETWSAVEVVTAEAVAEKVFARFSPAARAGLEQFHIDPPCRRACVRRLLNVVLWCGSLTCRGGLRPMRPE